MNMTAQQAVHKPPLFSTSFPLWDWHGAGMLSAVEHFAVPHDTAKPPQAARCRERQNPLGSRNRTEQ